MRERAAGAEASTVQAKPALGKERNASSVGGGLAQLSASVASSQPGVPIRAALRAPAEGIVGRSLGHARLHSDAALTAQTGGMRQELHQAQGLVTATRMALLAASVERGFPADLGQRWAQAKMALVQVETGLTAPALSAEIADAARDSLAAFYWAMARAAVVWEGVERSRHSDAQARLDNAESGA